MFYHGTDVKLNIGDVLVPGKDIGKDFGRSSHVYVTSSLEPHPTGSQLDYALTKAKQWAQTSYLVNEASTGVLYVYEVDVHGTVEKDDCDEETGEESFRCKAATILNVHRFPFTGLNFSSFQ